MPVLPELVPMLARIKEARAQLPDASMPVAERRAIIHRGMDQRAVAVARPAPQTVRSDHRVQVDGGSITVRSYRPDLPGALACHVYVHGGGWWLGDSLIATPSAEPSRQASAAWWSPSGTGSRRRSLPDTGP